MHENSQPILGLQLWVPVTSWVITISMQQKWVAIYLSSFIVTALRDGCLECSVGAHFFVILVKVVHLCDVHFLEVSDVGVFDRMLTACVSLVLCWLHMSVCLCFFALFCCVFVFLLG